MPADAPDRIEDDGPGIVEGLAPLLVADREDVEDLVRTSRAAVAVLSLQLRTAKQEATAAAATRSAWDLDGARSLLTAALDRQMAARRDEMAKELEATRAQAAQLVLRTRNEAAALVGQAGEETLDVLLAGSVPSPATAHPSLRIVHDGPDEPAPPPGRPSAVGSPAPSPAPTRAPTSAPSPTIAPAPPLIRAEPAAPAVAVEQAEERAVVPDAPSVAIPPVAAPTAAAPPVVPVVEPPQTTLVASVGTGPGPSPVTAQPGTAPAPHRGPLARFLYLDVLLPMVAVLLLLVLLLAWVG